MSKRSGITELFPDLDYRAKAATLGGTTVLIILGLIISGVIRSVWHFLAGLIAAHPNGVIGFGVGCLVVIILCILYLRHFVLQGKLSIDHLVSLNELDDTLMRLVVDLISTEERATRMENLLTEYLRDCARVFGPTVVRSYILRPVGDYLIPWANYEMSESTMDKAKFYIGDAEGLVRGIAGEVFRTREARVVHISETGGEIRPDDADYHVFDFDKDRVHIPYLSFIAVPLVWGEDTCLGVMCVDSANKSAFDSHEIQELLATLGRRIASAILLYQRLEADE